MRRILLLAALPILACTSPKERAPCTMTTDCGPGEYCAHTADGSVCWADEVAPRVVSTTVACVSTTQDGACARDGLVRITARVTDDHGIQNVTAAIATAPERSFSLTQTMPSGSDWAGTLSLAAAPFPSFAGDVVVTVKVTDEAGNVTSVEAPAPVHVSRLRWTFDAGAPLSPAAVTLSGAIVMGRADTTGQAIGVNTIGEEIFRLTLGTAHVVAAPTTWTGTWFASTGGTLYRVELVNDRYELKSQCATGAPMSAPPTLYGVPQEFAIAGNDGGSLYVDNAANVCDQTAAGGGVKSSAVVTRGRVYAVAGSAMRSFGVLSGGALDPSWTSPPVVGATLAAPAVDSTKTIWTVSTVGAVHRTNADGVSEQITTVGGEVNGIIILADDTAVIGDDSGKLKRLGAGAPWSETTVLSGTPAAPIALGGDDPVLLTGTSIGWLYAIRQSDGAIVWSQKLGSGALRIGNVFQELDELPTAYFPSSDGKLYAVVVDGDLDASAPWPKPYRDAQNTGNADVPRP